MRIYVQQKETEIKSLYKLIDSFYFKDKLVRKFRHFSRYIKARNNSSYNIPIVPFVRAAYLHSEISLRYHNIT